MTYLHHNVDFHLVNVFVHWLQSRYLHKLERYLAAHK
jgi:hypothetical protein